MRMVIMVMAMVVNGTVELGEALGTCCSDQVPSSYRHSQTQSVPLAASKQTNEQTDPGTTEHRRTQAGREGWRGGRERERDKQTKRASE